MSIEKILSPAERAEYHDLMEQACIDPATGKPRPSRELGDAIMAALQDAVRAGRSWAAMYLDDAAESALKTRGTRWLKTKYVVPVADGASVVSRAAVYSTRKTDPSGQAYYQPVLIRDMTAAELAELVDMDRAQVRSARLNLTTHQRLLELVEAWPAATTVGEALRMAGTTLDDFLSSAA